MLVLILSKRLLQNFQPQRQWCVKMLLLRPQNFYAPLVLGRGVKVSVAMFPSSGGGINLVSDIRISGLQKKNGFGNHACAGVPPTNFVTFVVSGA